MLTLTPRQKAEASWLTSMSRLSIARRQVDGANHFDAVETMKLHALSIAEKRDHAEQFPQAYRIGADEGWNGLAEDRPLQHTDCLVWTDQEMIERHATGRDPLRVRLIERAADDWLRANDPLVGNHENAAGEHRTATLKALAKGKPENVPNRPRLIRLDVVDPYTRQLTVSPDRVAFRGQVRRRVPAPIRYHVAKPADGWADSVWSCSIGIVPLSCSEYRTDRIGKAFAWVGHRKIATGAAEREARRTVKRKRATKVRRGESVGSRGIARTGWNLSERSLPRAWSRADVGQVACASLIVQLLTTSQPMVTVQLSDTFAVATDGVQAWRVKPEGEPVSILSAAMSIQQLARRAALAREDVA